MALDRSFENDRPWWPLPASQAYALLSRHAGLLWYAGAVVLGIAWCTFTGIDANYDRLNYHLPSASALLQGRLFEDVAISSVQTYFNPVINLFSYVLSRELGFFWSRYALVATQALAWAFLAAAVWRVVVLELAPKPAHGLVVGAAMAVLSLVAPLSILILGTSFADLIMATFIGAALLVRLPTGFEARPWRGALTGLILGIGVGLKPTILPICVAYGLVFYATLAMLTRPARAAAEFAAFGAAAAMATLLAAGPWALAVLKETGNPVFPYANDLFQSPFVPSVPMADNRFLPASLRDWLNVPARLAIGGDKITGEAYLRDIRFALFWYALVPALGICAAWRWRQAVAFCRSAPRTCLSLRLFHRRLAGLGSDDRHSPLCADARYPRRLSAALAASSRAVSMGLHWRRCDGGAAHRHGALARMGSPPARGLRPILGAGCGQDPCPGCAGIHLPQVFARPAERLSHRLFRT